MIRKIDHSYVPNVRSKGSSYKGMPSVGGMVQFVCHSRVLLINASFVHNDAGDRVRARLLAVTAPTSFTSKRCNKASTDTYNSVAIDVATFMCNSSAKLDLAKFRQCSNVVLLRNVHPDFLKKQKVVTDRILLYWQVVLEID